MSDTIGTVMMVAIVFLLSTIVGGSIISEYDSASADVYATVEFESNADDSVDVVWTKRGTADSIRVFNSTDTRTISELGESVTMTFGSGGNDISAIAEADDRETFLTRYQSPDFETSVYARSHSGDDPNPDQGQLVYNGTAITDDQGVTILTFKPDGTFYSHAYYDTHSNNEYRSTTTTLKADNTPDINAEQSCSGCAQTDAREHIRTRPVNHYILVIGQDQPGDLSDASNLEDEYQRMGAQFSNDDKLEAYDSFILASKKTKNGGGDNDEYERVFERHSPRTSQSGTDFVEAYFYAPQQD